MCQTLIRRSFLALINELALLYVLLGLGFTIAPFLSNCFFLGGSNLYRWAHLISLAILGVGALIKIRFLSLAWPAFCLFGAGLFLAKNFTTLKSLRGIAGGIPFTFSLISALWFVAAVHDWQLLGYDPTWSLYASLHGTFLGWIFVGCLAALAKRGPHRNFNLSACFLSFAFFLLVAFGIDGVPIIKRIGVVGFSLLMPLSIGAYAATVKSRAARAFIGLSGAAIISSMGFALLNEFWVGMPKMLGGFPLMVLFHGVLNAVLAAPFFFFAIRAEDAGRSRVLARYGKGT
ncbi:MAG: hypothetical protein EOP11_03645 [Proteobacteria bacterium]|nr:MAG: hypothetical protein EOP11_03645 [Pseudomonadota bacterium]